MIIYTKYKWNSENEMKFAIVKAFEKCKTKNT